MKWLAWLFLTMMTGNPILSLVVILLFYWGLDRFTLGILPDPLRIFGRLQRSARLERTLKDNPHDKRARTALADLLIARRRHRKAVETLRYNVEQGDDDARTYFLYGVALMGSGDVERGAASLEEARTIDESYGSGAIDLELGRGYLNAGKHAEAKEHLERFVSHRTGTIEGNVLLAKALAALGDEEGAGRARQAAWDDYVSSPRFVRKRDRWWAWRAKPARPLAYLAIAAACGSAISLLLVAGR